VTVKTAPQTFLPYPSDNLRRQQPPLAVGER
jgi:hypothetical protein